MGGSFHVLLALARRICLLYISTKTGCCSSFVCIQLLRDNYPLLLFNNSNFYFLYSLLGAASVMATIMSAIMLSATYALFSWKFGVNLYPYQPLASLALSAISGAFMMVLAMALVLVVINYAGVKNITFVGFIPLVMSYIFGFGQLYTTIPEYIEYASPFTAISSLLYASYGGFAIPKVFINPSAGTLNPSILLLSLIAWLLVLAVLDTQLLRRIRPRAIEEARQVYMSEQLQTLR